MGTGILLGYYLTSKDRREGYSSVKEQKSGTGIVSLYFSKLLSAALFYMQKLGNMF